MTAAELAPLALKLPPAERLQLANELYDSVSEEAVADPLPLEEWKLEELGRRVEWFRQNPESGMSWEEVRRNILARHAARQEKRA